MRNFENWKWFYLQADRNSAAQSAGLGSNNFPHIPGAPHGEDRTRIISIQHQHANAETRGSPIFMWKNGKQMKPQDARVESIWVSVAWISSTIYLPKAHCLLRSEHCQIRFVCVELESALCIVTHRVFHIRYSCCVSHGLLPTNILTGLLTSALKIWFQNSAAGMRALQVRSTYSTILSIIWIAFLQLIVYECGKNQLSFVVSHILTMTLTELIQVRPML